MLFAAGGYKNRLQNGNGRNNGQLRTCAKACLIVENSVETVSNFGKSTLIERSVFKAVFKSPKKAALCNRFEISFCNFQMILL